MLRSPWLGVLAIVVAGIVGFALSGNTGPLTLDAVTVKVRPTRDSGAPWDFGGGLPDPKVSVDQAGRGLAACPEVKDKLEVTCHVGAPIDDDRSVRVMVVDADTSEDDMIGEIAVDPAVGHVAAGPLEVDLVTSGGASNAWQRFRALWIALAVGLAVAGALAWYRRRHA